MQVTVENLGGLKRKVSIEVPLSDVESTYNEVYQRIAANVHVRGFRPGRFPRQLAEKRFKELMEHEAITTLVPKYLDDALKGQELRPATEPRFDHLHIHKQEPFRFEAEFEVVPSFEPPPLTEFKLERKAATLDPKEIDARIEALRLQFATLTDKGGEPAATGDVVIYDHEGTIDGQPFVGGTAKDDRLEVGNARYIKQFAEPFAGMRAGETKQIEVEYPPEYGENTLAGKKAVFAITVKKVEARVPAPLDEPFFKRFAQDIADEAGFRVHIEKQLMQQKERAIEAEYHAALIEQIKAKLTFAVPDRLVEANLHEFEHQLSRDDPEAAKDEQRLAKLKTEETERVTGNLRVGYFVDELAQRNDVKVDTRAVQERFVLQAYLMQQRPGDLLRTPQGERMLHQIEREDLITRTLAFMADALLGRTRSAPAAAAPAGAEPPAAATP